MAPIIMNDFTIATPYPSIIIVSNVSGVIAKATVTLTNLTHQSLNDVEVLRCHRASRIPCSCRKWALAGFSATHLTLTFDTTNYPALPSSGAVTNGTYRPTQIWRDYFPLTGMKMIKKNPCLARPAVVKCSEILKYLPLV